MVAAWLSSFLFTISFPLFAHQSKEGDYEARPLFQTVATLELKLSLPWQAIVSDEFFFQGSRPALLEVVDGRGKALSIPVEVERRGWSRQVMCRYPPIKLRFQKDKVKGTVFEGQKSLKLVIQCDDGEAYQQYIVLEALAYQMYNVVSDFSFRVRPLSLTIIDTETERVGRPRFAFLIEDGSEVAERNGQHKLKMTSSVRADQLEPHEASKLTLFQYMIDNSAWSFERKDDEDECCDNLKLLGQDTEVTPVYAIPNDFDLSGLVSAPYAQSGGAVQTGSDPKRSFQGFCAHNAALDDARTSFLNRENEIYSLVQGQTHLNDRQKNRVRDFLKPFFDELKSSEKFDRQLKSNCQD